MKFFLVFIASIFNLIFHHNSKIAVVFPTPTPTTIATSTPAPTPIPNAISTTIPQNGNLDITNGNSQIHIQNSGNSSSVHVETSGNGSADVSVHQDLHSSQSVSYSFGN